MTRASPGDLRALTALCLRSKAHWGYDADFMALCVPSLTVRAHHLSDPMAVIRNDAGGFAAVARVSVEGAEAELEKLFVDPAAMGRGHGRDLMDWALAAARDRGVDRLWITADPQAAPFYRRMGAEAAGTEPSDAIPGRHLPRMVCRLDPHC